MWTHVVPLPDEVPLDIAAASLLQGKPWRCFPRVAIDHSIGLSVLTQMTETYNVKKGDIILIHTVAGGLGLLLTAYAKSRGATVIGTTSTPEKAELARSYGADYVILYPTENTVERVLEITNGEGVHAVYDGVGKDTYVWTRHTHVLPADMMPLVSWRISTWFGGRVHLLTLGICPEESSQSLLSS